MADPAELVHGCLGKGRYSTRDLALAVAADCFRERGHWLRVYECFTCGGYHLTHKQALPKPGWREPKRSSRIVTEDVARARNKRRRSRWV